MKKNNIHQGPHKFQHLAKQAGISLEAISEALTHSNKEDFADWFHLKANKMLDSYNIIL